MLKGDKTLNDKFSKINVLRKRKHIHWTGWFSVRGKRQRPMGQH